MKQSDKPHPGINYHKFSVGGYWEGVFIVIACSALLFAIHTPFTGLFLIFSALLGIVIGMFLCLTRRDKLVNTHTFLPPADAAQEIPQLQTLSAKQEPPAESPRSSNSIDRVAC